MFLLVFLLAPPPILGAPTVDSASERVSPRGDTTPRFFIESIAVEGAGRSSSGIVVSGSLLEEGRGYSEAELREAVYRVHRLPFVVDAGFALGKGSERGRYRLLITVEEVETFFFGGDLIYSDFGGALAAGPALDDGLTDSLTAGARLFAGQGVFFAAVGDGDLQAGYTRYRLLGRTMLLRLAYSHEECCSVTLHELGLDPTTGTWTTMDESDRLELTLGLPLGGNHSLRLDASRLETGSAARRPFGDAGTAFDVSDVEQQEIELAWVYDTTDDPLFPTHGDAMTAGIGLRRLEGALSPATAGGPQAVAATEMSSRLIGLSLYSARHWPLSSRQTASLSLKLLLGRSQVEGVPVQADVPVPAEAGGRRFMSGDVDALEAALGVRYSLALWGNRKVRRWGELRWETVASLLYVETSPVYSLTQPLWGVSASSTLALRNSWGVFRVGFAILDFDGDL